jgi:hypothetical protein
MRRSLAIFAILGLALGSLACGGAEEEGPRADPQELAWLRQTSETLASMREELADLRAQALEEPTDAAPASDGQETPLSERIRAQESRIEELSQEYEGRLVGYINSLEIVVGQELTPEQLEAIRMKSDEDIAIAQEWIERGGDYRRALDIYTSALALDPENDRLLEARNRAAEMRYMTEERFAQVQRGMTKSEVREVLGPVNLHNVREYPEQNAEAWFYPKDEGAPAGVWFRHDPRQGVMTVYQKSFEVQAGT